MRALRFVLPAMAFLLACPSIGRALDVERVDWGFDGKIVPMMFNLVTIEVANNSNTMFTGDIRFLEGNGVSRTELPLVEAGLQIEPFGRRRLQFFPYIEDVSPEYSLVWGARGENRYSLDNGTRQIPIGKRATVVLRDPSTRVRVRLPTFNEEDLPTSASGMDCLKAVVLDHVPRWDGLRMQAFRDWIGGGGQVHLLHNETGDFPKFPAPLEALNEPSDVAEVGSGRVFRHAIQIPALTEDFIRGPLRLVPGSEDENRGQFNPNYGYQARVTSELARLLRELTRPNHNWTLIYLLSFVYLLVVFPGCWLLGRRRADFRVSYPVLIGAVLLFSMAFKSVGQRGYGEETAWNAVGTARRVGPGRFLAEVWSNSFVTAGGTYTYHHNAEGLIYSSGGADDARFGKCVNRPAASLQTEIPPFSSQTFLHSAVVKAPDLDIQLTKASTTGSPQFEFQVTGKIPDGSSIHASYGKDWFNVVPEGNKLVSQGGTPFNSEQRNNYGNPGYGYGPKQAPAQIYPNAETPLVNRVMRVLDETIIQQPPVAVRTDHVRLYVFADMPKEFLDVDGGPEKRQGRLLYSWDFPVDKK